MKKIFGIVMILLLATASFAQISTVKLSSTNRDTIGLCENGDSYQKIIKSDETKSDTSYMIFFNDAHDYLFFRGNTTGSTLYDVLINSYVNESNQFEFKLGFNNLKIINYSGTLTVWIDQNKIWMIPNREYLDKLFGQ